MMPGFLRYSIPLAVGLAALHPSACRNSSRSGQSEASSRPPSRGVDGFFAPEPGETWIYEVRREVPFEAGLPAADKAAFPDRTDTSHLTTTERRRTCTGAEQVPGAKHPLTVIDLYEDEQFRGRELYDINPRGVFSRGWLDAKDNNRSHVLEQGVAVAPRALVPGTSWLNSGRDAGRLFHFRIVERTSVTVPAGTFETARIQITNHQHGKGLKRTIWFAENVGIVKEESVYYDASQVHIRERAILTDWILPETPTASSSPPRSPRSKPPSAQGPDPATDRTT